MWRLILGLLLLCVPSLAAATVFTVKPSGGDFTTFQACATAATAGDVCDGYTGSYAGWTQGTSGTSGHPITFQAHPGETVTITSGTITLDGRTYITIQNLSDIRVPIHADGTTAYCLIQGNHFTTVLAFYNVDGVGVNAHDNVFRGNTVNMNTYQTADTSFAVRLYGNNNLFENNEIYNGSGDAFELGGQYVVVRGNYFHDSDGTVSGEHIDFMQVIGGTTPALSFSLIENNVAKNLVNQAHFTQIRASGGDIADTIITRFNFTYHLDSDFSGYGDHHDGTNTVPNGSVYHNTANRTTTGAENGLCVGFDSSGGTAWAYNNICYNLVTGGFSPTIYTQGGTGNGNLAFTTGYAGSWNAPYSSEATYAALRNQDPLFANYPTEATLQAGSPAKGAGVALTTVAGGDAGTGTSLVLTNARVFQPGWAGTHGDTIRVGASTVASITAIDYSTNTATLASGISRSPGDPVYLYADSGGRRVLFNALPDVGAAQCCPPPGLSGAATLSGKVGMQ